ncbi:MAG TPA: hypothetical protein VJ111_05505 [Chitinophagaceae bacterium]|nr:hypothetical protein [Chitinophagaceae bacterium]
MTCFKELTRFKFNISIRGDTFTRTLTKQVYIDIYKEVINGKQKSDLKCDSTGRILYFIQDSLRFEAYFSTPSTGSKYEEGVATIDKLIDKGRLLSSEQNPEVCDATEVE